MITKIKMDKVACFKNPTSFDTDKKINLIYGLNGTGKSTLSDYLYDRANPIFARCSIDSSGDEEILVYNQSFIRDYFYQPDNLKCIFTLSKENKEAEEKIRNAEREITRISIAKTSKDEELTLWKANLSLAIQKAQDKVWEIKTKYAGGDRVLEYCLDNLKGKKESLFTYILSVPRPESQPSKTVSQLKKEVDSVQGTYAQRYDLLPTIDLVDNSLETDQIFMKAIVGNENSIVAELIKNIGNSDWVKEGLNYIDEIKDDQNTHCPFCQERTISSVLIKNIENYFDETYENDINKLNLLLSKYVSIIDSLPKKTDYNYNPFIIEKNDTFENLYNAVIQILSSNKEEIIRKIKTPSQTTQLEDSSTPIVAFNEFISEMNVSITEHNDRIKNKEKTLESIKMQFWTIMRWDYDQTISTYQKEKTDIEEKINEVETGLKRYKSDTETQQSIIVEQQGKTVNIKEAIDNINAGLLELGIDGFTVEKHTDVLYKIVRSEQCENTFETLSEGEKMIISFLYFRELCKGKKSTQSQSKEKIVVIDDPISSLSHIYIFNIGQMIKNDFFASKKYGQVFLFTHSLYFFYEMAISNSEKRKKSQKLFRLNKNSDGSKILEMKYEEIQNDYQSYWFVVKDEKQPPALIANCMRNIIEYFFNFIEKKDLNNVFQKPELKDVKYQAFNRYINRESHSSGQNIFDIKEFNYDDFKEAFRLVFAVTNYEEHYKRMIK
ncbi:MAG: AAA family ATPase [Clostridiaceae bacterium]|nr:AAA family ATPase [Clostridiaceae bacterium]